MAVETRPAVPHSVTTVCLVHEGNLYVAAHYSIRNSWPYYAIAEPRVRIKIRNQIYPVMLAGVTDMGLIESIDKAGRQKTTIVGRPDEPLPERA